MNLAATLALYFGGPGSGCSGPNCGRPVVTNSREFRDPPSSSARDESAMDHYVVQPDGTAKRVNTHIDYFRKEKANGITYKGFLKDGGIIVTVGSGGPGVTFGRKDEATVEKVIQVIGHPAFRSFDSNVSYIEPGTMNEVGFHGGRPGTTARELREWVGQRNAH